MRQTFNRILWFFVIKYLLLGRENSNFVMKILLIALAALTFVACNRFGGKNEKIIPPTEKRMQMTGAYGQQRPLRAEEAELFRTMTTGLVGVSYTPQSVATQVVAGTNYRFICNAVTATHKPQSYQAEVVVYQPLPGQGEARITKITRL